MSPTQERVELPKEVDLNENIIEGIKLIKNNQPVDAIQRMLDMTALGIGGMPDYFAIMYSPQGMDSSLLGYDDQYKRNLDFVKRGQHVNLRFLDPFTYINEAHNPMRPYHPYMVRALERELAIRTLEFLVEQTQKNRPRFHHIIFKKEEK